MKKWIYYIPCLLALAACSNNLQPEAPDYEVPEGKAIVDLTLGGYYTDLRNATTRAGEGDASTGDEEIGKDETTLQGNDTHPLPDGSTLWLLAEKTKDADGKELETPQTFMHSCEVRTVVVPDGNGGTAVTSALYPCEVDEDGNVTQRGGNPLMLDYGTYVFSAVSPARKLNEDLSLTVHNGEYLISTDNRYKQTKQTTQTISAEDGDVVQVQLNPLMNQTAQLKFTVYSPHEDVSIHHLDVLSSGVEISGLQGFYTQEDHDWNWRLGNPLQMAIGHKNESYTVYEYTHPEDGYNDSFVIETGILPTDATSTPLIILFNLEVNGIPTVYEMTLNEKVFKGGYSYHYRGKVTITDGVTSITWHRVSWDTEVDFGESNQQ